MSEIRKRSAADGKEAQVNGATAIPVSSSSKKNVEDLSNKFRVTDVLRILGGILLLNCALSWFVTNNSIAWGWRPWFSKPGDVRAWMVSPPLFLCTREEAQLQNPPTPKSGVHTDEERNRTDRSTSRIWNSAPTTAATQASPSTSP